jgi:hypothetical protein
MEYHKHDVSVGQRSFRANPMNHELSELAKRVEWLLKNVWEGVQVKMASEIGVTQSAISNIITGRQQPGRKFLAAVASNPAINSKWLISGDGEPLARPNSEPGRRALYVARTLFEGLPDDHGDCLGDMLEVPLRLYRPTRYWFEIPADCPLVSVSSLKIAVGDLMLFEPDQKGWPDSIKGHPCIIKDTDNRLTFTHVTDQQDGSVSISSSTDKSRDDSRDGKRFREFTFHDEVPSQKVSSQSVKATIIAIGIFRMGGFTMS